MSPKRISYALTIAFVLHALIIGTSSVYLLNQTPRFKEFIETKVLPPAPSSRRERRPLVRFAVQPSVSSDRYIVRADGHKQARHITIRHPEQTPQPRTIVVFSSRTTCTIGRYLPIYVPQTSHPITPPLSDTSHTDLFLSNVPQRIGSLDANSNTLKTDRNAHGWWTGWYRQTQTKLRTACRTFHG